MALGRSTLSLLIPLLVAGPSAPAAADPPLPPDRLRPAEAVEILADLDLPGSRGDRLVRDLGRVDLSGKYGLIYSRDVQVGERGMQFRLRGPALGRQKRFGLSFEARF